MLQEQIQEMQSFLDACALSDSFCCSQSLLFETNHSVLSAMF